VYSRICTYIHVFAGICTYVHVFARICTYTHVFARICTYAPHKLMHVYPYITGVAPVPMVLCVTYRHIYATYIHHIYTTYIYSYVHIYRRGRSGHSNSKSSCVCTHTPHVCMCVYTHTTGVVSHATMRSLIGTHTQCAYFFLYKHKYHVLTITYYTHIYV